MIDEPAPALSPEIIDELAAALEGELAGFVLKDPQTGRFSVRRVDLEPAPERAVGRLYLEWINAGGRVRTVAAGCGV